MPTALLAVLGGWLNSTKAGKCWLLAMPDSAEATGLKCTPDCACLSSATLRLSALLYSSSGMLLTYSFSYEERVYKVESSTTSK